MLGDRAGVVALTAVLVAAGLAAVLLVTPREERSVYANERVAAELPTHPEAIETSREHHEEHQNEAFLPTGWTTSITYQVPTSTTAEDVIAFFEVSAPSDWQRGRPAGAGADRALLAMCRGGEGPFGDGAERVVVVADNVETQSMFSLHVDHDYQPGPRC